jgi:hypothetical protein
VTGSFKLVDLSLSSCCAFFQIAKDLASVQLGMKKDDSKDSLYEELEQLFNHLLGTT